MRGSQHLLKHIEKSIIKGKWPFDSKLWIFYDDGEYIRYITYDGENFDYAEAIEQDDKPAQTEALLLYWWLIALAGIVAIILASYFYWNRNGGQDDVAEELEKDNHL